MAVIYTELRVGNLLYFGNPKATLKPVYFKIEGGHSITAVTDGIDVHPIPLSEDFLLSIGFTLMKESEYTLNTYELNGVKLWNKKGDFTSLLFNGRTEIKSVHQLQNLYFAITDEELSLIS